MADPVASLVPAASDNGTVILWAVTVLMIALVAAVKFIHSVVVAREETCNKERVAMAAKHDAQSAEIKSLYQGVIMDQKQTQVQSNAAMEKMAEAVSGHAEVTGRMHAYLERVGASSGSHPAQKG